jgi:hypothetical protein
MESTKVSIIIIQKTPIIIPVNESAVRRILTLIAKRAEATASEKAIYMVLIFNLLIIK